MGPISDENTLITFAAGKEGLQNSDAAIQCSNVLSYIRKVPHTNPT